MPAAFGMDVPASNAVSRRQFDNDYISGLVIAMKMTGISINATRRLEQTCMFFAE